MMQNVNTKRRIGKGEPCAKSVKNSMKNACANPKNTTKNPLARNHPGKPGNGREKRTAFSQQTCNGPMILLKCTALLKIVYVSIGFSQGDI